MCLDNVVLASSKGPFALRTGARIRETCGHLRPPSKCKRTIKFKPPKNCLTKPRGPGADVS